MKLIELNLEKICELCRKYKVKTLSVFGSILTDRFNDESDIDFQFCYANQISRKKVSSQMKAIPAR